MAEVIELNPEVQELISKAVLTTSDIDGISHGITDILMLAGVNAKGHNLVNIEEFVSIDDGLSYQDLIPIFIKEVSTPSGLGVLTLGQWHSHLLIKDGHLVGCVVPSFINGYPSYSVLVIKQHEIVIRERLEAIKLTLPKKQITRVTIDLRQRMIVTNTVTFRQPLPHPNIRVNYPFLNETPEELWSAFSESEESVLFMIGPPGTGKSTLIRMMIDARGWREPPLKPDVFFVARQSVLLEPAFLDFLENLQPGSLVVVEDGDGLVEKRSNGNFSMTTILDLVDGLSVNDIKFIFSTNLESMVSVDPALIREGRTFDVLKFRHLTLDEANVARRAIDLPDIVLKDDVTNLSLAKALNFGKSRTANRITNVGYTR